MTGRGRTRLRRLSSAAARQAQRIGFLSWRWRSQGETTEAAAYPIYQEHPFHVCPSLLSPPSSTASVHPSIHPKQDRHKTAFPPSRRARPFLRPSSGRESLSRFASLPPSDLSRIREEGTIVHGRDKGAWVVRAQLRMRRYRSNRSGSVSLSHVSCGSRSIARMIWRSCATTLEISARKPLRRR